MLCLYSTYECVWYILFLVFGDIVVPCEYILAYATFPCAVRPFITDSCPAGQQRILQGIDLVIKDSV